MSVIVGLILNPSNPGGKGLNTTCMRLEFSQIRAVKQEDCYST
jgi:hypothetical protein